MRMFLAGLMFVSTLTMAGPAFTPMYQGTKTISCTGSSSATQLPATAATSRQVELQNAGTAAVFVEFGGSGIVAAAASGYALLAGQGKLVTIDATVTYVACISSTGTQTVYVTVGTGD